MKIRDLFRSKRSEALEPVVAAAPEASSASSTPGADRNWESLYAQASTALQSGALDEAIQRYDALIALRPDFAESYYKLGNAYNRLGRWPEALAAYDRAVAVDPQYANAFCNRGTVLERLERWDDALESYDRALALNPGDAFAYYNRAGVLRELQRFDEAITGYDRAIALNSGYVAAYVNRGHLLLKLARQAPAAASYDKAIELSYNSARSGPAAGGPAGLRPEQRYLPGLRRQALMQICDWQGIDADRERIAAGLRKQLPVTLPLVALTMLPDPTLHRAAAESWILEEAPPNPSLGTIPTRTLRPPKIRVGYFSADFRTHPVAYLTAGMFEQHDRSKFELTAFAFGPETNDSMRARMSKAFDRFIDVRARTDAEVAALARDLEIDIAVNLNGITEFSRTGIFALRAAPLQLNYLGYPGTMGAPFMDYIIADGVVVSRAQQRHYRESILYLPDSFMPFDSSYPIASRQFTREELGLPDTALVYCCFNNIFKLTPEVFGAWMRILARHPDSVLWLSHTNATAVGNLRKEASQRGVDARRLVFAERLDSLPEHLARLRSADLFLDTFPYNAHATALDALWAGVPVLTYAGESFASRVAASLLSVVGLPELITSSLVEYEGLAVSLAADRERLGQLRTTLAQNRSTTSLFDTARYVSNLESAYETIYARHLSGAPPSHVNDVSDESPLSR